MRDVRRVDVAKPFAANIDNLSIRKDSRRPVRHIGDRKTTADHAVRKLRLRDKSFLQSLSTDEAVWFDHFFMPIVCPVFYVERLGTGCGKCDAYK